MEREVVDAGIDFGILIDTGRYDTDPYTVYVQGQYAYETFRYDYAVIEVFRHLPVDVQRTLRPYADRLTA